MKKLLVWCSVGALGFFWCAFGVNRTLLARRPAVLQHLKPMQAINGVVVRLDPYVEPAGVLGISGGRHLLIMSSDRCPYSQQAVAKWKEILGTIEFGPKDQVILLSVYGETIPAALQPIARERGVASQIVRLHSALAFSQETGLGVTPITAALDSDHAIRVITSHFTPAYVEELRRYFERSER